jgi:hypothetical protein
MWNGFQRGVAQWNPLGSSELINFEAMVKVALKTCILPLLFSTESLFVLGATATRGEGSPQLRGF